MLRHADLLAYFKSRNALPFSNKLINRPNPRVAKYNVAVCESDGEIEFLQITGYAQMLSGIVGEYDAQHLQRIEHEVKEFGGTMQKIKVHGARFDSIMKNHQKHIDYLSIDVEGGEMKILQNIDFAYYDIALIGIENNYKIKDIPNLLQTYGYKKIMELGCDEFYAKMN